MNGKTAAGIAGALCLGVLSAGCASASEPPASAGNPAPSSSPSHSQSPDLIWHCAILTGGPSGGQPGPATFTAQAENAGSATVETSNFTVAFYNAAGSEIGSRPSGRWVYVIKPGQAVGTGQMDQRFHGSGVAASCKVVSWQSLGNRS